MSMPAIRRIALVVVLAAVAVLVCAATLGAARPEPVEGAPDASATRLLRTPTVSATHIAFGYANNLWVVERAGGQARRLTSFQSQTTNPRFSPDGKLIAVSGDFAGYSDV